VKGPCLTLLVSRRRFRDGSRGGSPDLRISLLANAFPAVCRPVTSLLAFVPAYSGASVRELHPLPKCITSRVRITIGSRNYHLLPHMSTLIFPHQDQWVHRAVPEAIVDCDATRAVDRRGSRRSGDGTGLPCARFGGRLRVGTAAWTSGRSGGTQGGPHCAPDSAGARKHGLDIWRST
jgi:hypothetical protein